MTRSYERRNLSAALAGVTSYDVARLAGVSQSAVSRCFSAGGSISQQTRRKVEEAAHRLGYRPNAIARSLITRRSGLLGLVVTDKTLRFSPEIVYDLCDRLRDAGMMPLLTTLSDENELGAALPRILAYRPEAVVSLATVSAHLVTFAARNNVPFILVNRSVPTDTAAITVCCNHSAAVRDLAQRLIASGHRRNAFVAGPKDAPVSVQRLKGFKSAMSMAGLVPAWIEHADYSYDGGRAVAIALLKNRPLPDAIMCANDAMAIGVLDACRFELGLKVPETISITGFDDIAESGHPTRSLTTIRQPTAAIASAVVDALETMVNSPDGVQRQKTLLAGELIVRSSARI